MIPFVGLRLFVVTNFLILTLVGVQTWSAPHSEAPVSKDPNANTTNYEVEEPTLLDNTSITEVPPSKQQFQEFVQAFNRRDYYHSYRQSIYAHLGAVIAVQDSTDYDHLMSLSAGFMWQPNKQFSPMWEYGATWTYMGLGHIVAVRKHVYNEKGAFRPFYKYGVTLKIDPDEQGANLADFKNYLARVGIGLENILKPPRSVRMDLDLAVGQEDIWILFQYGYAWGL